MSWALLVQQLQISASASSVKPHRFNPRPPGQILAGSGTAAVLNLLKSNPDCWFTRAQIITWTGKSPKAVDWAAAFLVQQGLIRTVQDTTRNVRYRRYSYGKNKTAATD